MFTCNVYNLDWGASNRVYIWALCGSVLLYMVESVVILSRWRASVKSPITTSHCCPRKSFVRRELRADSAEKLGRKFSPILRNSPACPSSVHLQFRWYSNKQLPPRNRSCDITVFFLNELFNNILKELAYSPHPLSPPFLSLSHIHTFLHILLDLYLQLNLVFPISDNWTKNRIFSFIWFIRRDKSRTIARFSIFYLARKRLHVSINMETYYRGRKFIWIHNSHDINMGHVIY